ncbi:hypothetical protein [Streptomyces sp. SID5910]|uniref:hypothetical protein n=1 Tax=Streptomyces sp. SID5910 TaxID=2690312 RepID=UPI001F21A928|nr:hypothetical protein [Streptomyces sp. SID5910]
MPRYATPATPARLAGQARERARATAAQSASGIPAGLVALVTPLPADGGPVPGEIIQHQAHAAGHAARPASLSPLVISLVTRLARIAPSSSRTGASSSPATCSPTS